MSAMKNPKYHEYRSTCGKYMLRLNPGDFGRWERDKGGWLLFKNKAYLAWVSSVEAANKLLRAMGGGRFEAHEKDKLPLSVPVPEQDLP